VLTFDEFNTLTEPFVRVYDEFQESVIRSIVRSLAKLNFASAAWSAQRLSESGLLFDEIMNKLSMITGISERELLKVFKEAGITAIKFDDRIYRLAGLDPVPLNLSPAMLNVLKTYYVRTNGILQNLTRTTALTAEMAFIEASDIAALQISSGTMTYQQAIKEAIVNVASTGVQVIEYPSNRKTSLDAAVRRTVLTGIGQTTGKLQLTRAQEMNCDLVAVSAHIGARDKGDVPENHLLWQGRVYSISGNDPKYPSFYQVTGYGTGEGLNGYGCRHSFYPFFRGISENAYSEKTLTQYANREVKYNGQTISFYDATQIQRGIERKIRKTKRIIAGLKAAEQPTFEFDQKLKAYQAEMRSFINQTGIQRQRFREQIFA
jgi:hypothetical protein